MPKYTAVKGSKQCLAVPFNTLGREDFDTVPCLFITESILDAYLVNNLGFFGIGIPSAGYKLKDEEWAYLSTKLVLFVPDNDAAGKGAKAQFEGFNGAFLNGLEGCKDIGEYVKKYGRAAAEKLLQDTVDKVVQEEGGYR